MNLKSTGNTYQQTKNTFPQLLMISMFLGERAAQPYQASRETKDGDTNKVAGC